VRIAVCLVLLPWLSVLAAVPAGGDLRAAAAGGVLAGLLSAAVALRSDWGGRIAAACGLATAFLSGVAVVVAYIAWVSVECRDTGLDRC
jgi:hypothetical protein